MKDPEIEKFLRQLKGPPIRWRERLIEYAYLVAWLGFAAGLASLLSPIPGPKRRMLFGAIGGGVPLISTAVAVAVQRVSARLRRRSQDAEDRSEG